MTLEGLGCFAPDKNDSRLYDNNTVIALPTGVRFPVTTIDSVAPPDSARWLLLTSAFSFAAINIIANIPFGGPTIKDFNWMCQRGARIRGTLGAGQTSRYLQIITDGSDITIYIEWVRVSDSTFNWRLTKTTGRTLLATGSTVFSTDTTYALRLQLDGANATLWVDGTQEIEVAFTERFNSQAIAAWKPENTGQQHYYSGILTSHGDSTADRPDTDVEIATLENTGDYATDQDFGDESVCNSTDAVAADVALNGITEDVDISIFWCRGGGGAGEQGVEMGTATFPVGKAPMVLSARYVAQASIAVKTVATFCRSSDGTSTDEREFINLDLDTFRGRFQHFEIAPDGGVWTQADLDALKLSVRSVDTNGANDEWAAVIAEMCWVSADPPEPEGGLEDAVLRGVGRGVLRGVA